MKIKEAVIVLLLATTLFFVFRPKPQKAASDDKTIKHYKIPTITEDELAANPIVQDAYIALTAYITAYNAGEPQEMLDELCKDIMKEYQMPLNQFIGIDLGIKDFIVTSEAEVFDNIKIKRNNQKKLIKLNRTLSRKQKDSHNKNKARIKLAKFHEKLNNKKENYLHQVSNQLLNENQIIVMEDLNVKGMLKNHNLARSIQELSLCHFKEMLKYKAEWQGRYIVEVDRFYPSSKLCSNCGYKNNELTLKNREWTCPECKTHHNRDLNAAINIRNEGQRIIKNKIPIRCGEFKPLESSQKTLDELGNKNYITNFL